MTTPSRICSKCGARIVDDAPSGACPACLLSVGLSAGGTRDGEDGGAGGGSMPGPVPGSGPVPRQFGEYELLEEVARGGMGVVYRARQPNLRRVVALKMIGAGAFASREAVSRFHVEAAAVARLEHAHIVPVHEFGEHAGRHYLCLKWVAGGSLADRLRAGRFAGRQAAALMAKVARAVAHAHERGVLHRDLKPGNILCDEGGEPHVTDFGLARLAGEPAGMTGTQAVLGSPAYMSPEQAAGRPGEVTTVSDVYGLGAVLYEVLTGHPPFAGATPVEVLRQVIHEEPVRPRTRAGDVDRDLEVIALKCLEKEPARRYRSALEVAEDLERWLAGSPILARRAGGLERAIKWSRRRPAVAALGLALILSMAVGFGGILWQWRSARAAAARAEESAREARSAAAPVLSSSKVLELGFPGRLALLATGPGLVIEARQAGESGGLAAWSIDTGRQVHDFEGLEGAVARAALSGNGERLATWTAPSWPFWRSVERTGPAWHEVHQGHVFAMGLAQGNGGVGVGAEVVLWETRTGRRVGAFRTRPGDAPILVMALNTEGTLLATGHRDGAVHLWDATRGVHRRALPGHATAVQWVEFSGDGSRVLSCPAGWVEGTVGTTPRHDPLLARVCRVADGGEVGRLRNRASRWRSWGAGARAERVRATFHPDGTRLAVWSERRVNAGLWDITSGKRLGGGAEDGVEVLTAAFSRDGRWMAMARADGELEVLEATTGALHRRLRGHRRAARLLVFSPDSRRLLSGADDLDLRLWDVESGIGLTLLKGHARRDLNAAFTGPTTVVSTAADGSVRHWAALTEEQAAPRLTGHRGRITGLEFTPDARTLISASEDGSARVWQVETGSLRHEVRASAESRVPGVTGAFRAFRDLAIGGEGRWFMAICEDYEVRRRSGWLPFGPYRSLAFRPVGFWDVAAGESRLALDAGPRGARLLVPSPDGARVAVLESDFEPVVRVGGWLSRPRRELKPPSTTGGPWLRIHDTTTGALQGRVPGSSLLYQQRAAFSPDGTWFVVAFPDELGIYDLAGIPGNAREDDPGWEPEKILPKDHHGEFSGIRFWTRGTAPAAAPGSVRSRRESLLAVRRGHSVVEVWDPDGWRRVGRVDHGPERVAECWLRGNGGEELLVWLESGTLLRYDWVRNAELARRGGFRREFWNLRLSADGEVFVAGQGERQIMATEVESGRALGTYDGHLSRVTAVAVSRDGAWLASGDEEGLVRIWRGRGAGTTSGTGTP